jgi:glutaminase
LLATASARDSKTEGAAQTPLRRFLVDCHTRFAKDAGGAVADYIPELTKADPAHFGVSLATIDGYVYEIGDSAVPFTIQSISKAFVFALALETLGADRVEAVIGVEPSGEAFNSIRLTSDNRPFNPMVNAGAIACCGLICHAEGDKSFELIRKTLSRFAGRELGVDEAVFASERATGDRNRAIAWLLRNYAVFQCDVDRVLDVYFRQCSVLVTARDLAIMAATLANGGTNPVTGENILSPYAVARTLSVMTSSGMYDYAGEWIYRVGIPAKSGVGGGIIAALPAQLGLGTFSPRLDSHGNSLRGLKVCEAISSYFGLHVLNRSDDVRTCIFADYDIAGISSRRSRRPHELQILEQRHDQIRVIELIGSFGFSAMDYISRRLAKDGEPRLQFIILDFRRVPGVTLAASRILEDAIVNLVSSGGMTVVLAGVEEASPLRDAIGMWSQNAPKLRMFSSLDEAIEWTEDQIIYRYGGFVGLTETTQLDDQALLAGFEHEELAELSKLCASRNYKAGQRIVGAGEPAKSLFFLKSGMVSVKLTSGARLATIAAGMVFGEMALIEQVRSADVWADTEAHCLELPMAAYATFREKHPLSGERIMRNLAILLAKRLVQANAKVDLLSAY